MIESLIVDTDLASLHLRGTLDPDVELLMADRFCFITYVTLAEAYQGATFAGWDDATTNALVDAYLQTFTLLPWDDTIPRQFGRISGKARLAHARAAGKRRFNPPVNDFWIAAHCLTYELPLLTLNRKDYANVADLRLLEA